ncbi:hypothetical protein EG328_005244 [Venturia inaequalis]|uniref:Uncharacterized protein n=1 Tax=Venturia inaequalis TaxID=5025 RepID=A0A8H3YWZ0_VENIN|nr:hypothetical protein EG328_005244 [Venturia inaequalis]
MALAVTASIAAALPDDTSDSPVAHRYNHFHSKAFKEAQEAENNHNKRDKGASLQSLRIEIIDPAFWSKSTCLTECLAMEQQCRNTGVPQDMCADQVCTDNVEYCDCFCQEYKCRQDAGAAFGFCQVPGNKAKRGFREAKKLAVKEKEDKRNDAASPIPIEKRKIEIITLQPYISPAGVSISQATADPMASHQPVTVGSKRNVDKAVETIEKRDCASNCEALYQDCNTVSSESSMQLRPLTRDTDAMSAPPGPGIVPHEARHCEAELDLLIDAIRKS